VHIIVTQAGAHRWGHGKTSRVHNPKENAMKVTHTIAGGAIALLAVGGFGAFTGLSQAGATTTKAPVAATASATPAVAGPDVEQGGNTQVGDQSAPDTATTPEAPETPETASAAEKPGAPETAGVDADGPGGHTDAPGAAGANTQQ